MLTNKITVLISVEKRSVERGNSINGMIKPRVCGSSVVTSLENKSHMIVTELILTRREMT